MKIQSYLIVSNTGVLAIRKTRPALSNNEIAVVLNLNIPDAFFERLIPVVDIKVPENAIIIPDIEVVTSITAREVAEKLQLDEQMVHDGLKEMILSKKENK